MIAYIGNLRNKTLPHLEYSVQSLNACALINLDYISQCMLMKPLIHKHVLVGLSYTQQFYKEI